MGIVLNNIGAAYNAMGRFSDALPLLLEANSLTRRGANAALLAGNLMNIGFSHAGLGDTAQAIESYREALGISGQIGMKKQEADLRHRLDQLDSVSRR